jgi:hypothetical protein
MAEGIEVLAAVVERLANWPRCIEAIREGIPNVVVVAQQPREPVPQLVRRVEKRLRTLAREGRQLRVAVLSTSSHHGREMVEARREVARCLLRSLDACAHSSVPLWICAPDAAPDSLRHELMTVAEELTETLDDSSRVKIQLRFRDP